MVREGSAPNFCPPTEEGITITLVDEKGEQVELEFLGLVLKGESSFGFFFPVDDEVIAAEAYADFQEAAKDLYDFA